MDIMNKQNELPVGPGVNDWKRDANGVVLPWVARVVGGGGPQARGQTGHAARPESQIMGQEPGQGEPRRTRPSQAKNS